MMPALEYALASSTSININILINYIIQCYPIDIILEKKMYKVYMGINE